VIYLEKDNFMPKKQLTQAASEWGMTGDAAAIDAKLDALEEEALARIKAKVNFTAIETETALLRALCASYVSYKLFEGTIYDEYATDKMREFYACLGDIRESQQESKISAEETVGTPSRFL